MISAKDIRLQLLNLANGEGDIEDWVKSDLCNGEFSTLSKFKEIYRSGYKWRSTYDTEMILVNQCWSASRFYSDLQKAVNIFFRHHKPSRIFAMAILQLLYSHWHNNGYLLGLLFGKDTYRPVDLASRIK